MIMLSNLRSIACEGVVAWVMADGFADKLRLASDVRLSRGLKFGWMPGFNKTLSWGTCWRLFHDMASHKGSQSPASSIAGAARFAGSGATACEESSGALGSRPRWMRLPRVALAEARSTLGCNVSPFQGL